MGRNTEVMYDVIYIDAHGAETPVAQQLDDRKDAANAAIERPRDRLLGALRPCVVDLDDGHVDARARAHLGDARAHQAAPDHTDPHGAAR